MAGAFVGCAVGKACFAVQGRLGLPSGPEPSVAEHERYVTTVMDVAAAQWSAAATGLLAALLVLATVARPGRRVPRALMLGALGLMSLAVGAGALVMVGDGFLGGSIGWRWWHGLVGVAVLYLLGRMIHAYVVATHRGVAAPVSRPR